MSTKSGRIRRAKELKVDILEKPLTAYRRNPQTKRGSNSANCPPSVKTTPYSAKSALGVSVAEYIQYRQRVK